MFLLTLLFFLFNLGVLIIASFIFIGGLAASFIFSISKTHAFVLIGLSTMILVSIVASSVITAYLHDLVKSLDIIGLIDGKKNRAFRIRSAGTSKKTSNSEACPCGSGKKFRNCCYRRKGNTKMNEIRIVRNENN